MDEKTENYNIENLKIYLKKQEATFKKQFKEIEKKYPLVAFTFHLQEATIMDLLLSTTPQSQSVGSLLSPIDDKWIRIKFDNISIEKMRARVKATELRRKKCWFNLFRDMQSVQTLEDIRGVGRTFANCFFSSYRP